MSQTEDVNGVATTGPVVSGVAGGLAGLRELIRSTQGKLPSDSSADNTADKKSASKPQRHAGKYDQASLSSLVNSELGVTISSQDVIYGELVSQNNRLKEACLYVEDTDQLVVYSSSLFPGREREYCRMVKSLLFNRNAFAMAKVSQVQVFVNKHHSIDSRKDYLIYHGKYKIICANNIVLKTVKTILGNLASAGDDSQSARPSTEEINLARSKQAEQKVKEEAPDQAASADASVDLIDQIVQVQKVAHRVVQKSVLEPADAMDVFLILGEASPGLLNRVLDTDDQANECAIDQLRRLGALGNRRVDGTYPLLIKNLKSLISQPADRDPVGMFRAAVRTELVRGKQLVYDLDELCLVKVADQYIELLANFCRASRNKRLKNLFSQVEQTVAVSTVLKAISADDQANLLGYTDLTEFHQQVTKPMLINGWLLSNPTDGFPWLQFQVDDTDKLKVDTLRYLATNLSWLLATCSDQAVQSLVGQINSLVVPNEFQSAGDLRKSLISRIMIERVQPDNYKRLDQSQLQLDRPSKALK